MSFVKSALSLAMSTLSCVMSFLSLVISLVGVGSAAKTQAEGALRMEASITLKSVLFMIVDLLVQVRLCLVSPHWTCRCTGMFPLLQVTGGPIIFMFIFQRESIVNL